MSGVRREWIGGNDFIMLHLDLVDALDGSYEAAALLNRIQYRAGDTGWVASRAEMRADTRLTEWKLDAAVKRLREAGFIASERDSHIDSTLRWWVVYEDGILDPVVDATSPTVVDESSTTPSTKKVRTLAQPAVERPIKSASHFETWWHLYPRKVGRQAALKAWAKALNQPGVTIDSLLVGIRAQRAGMLAQIEDGRAQYVPHPATWLNRGSWDDDPLPVKRRTKEEQMYDEGYR